MLSPATRAHERPPAYDPGWLIHRTLDETADRTGASAEDAVLAWLVRLPDDTDPADAAADIIAAYAPERDDGGDHLATRIFALLAEIRDYPRSRLARLPRARRGRRRPVVAD
jgi:hypothetical protein